MSTAALTWEQFRFERKLFWRNPTAAFFNFVLPLLLLFLVATAFSSEGDELDTLIPGIAGMSVMATTFTALAYVLVYRREEGILKRVRGTPMPAASGMEMPAGFVRQASASTTRCVACVPSRRMPRSPEVPNTSRPMSSRGPSITVPAKSRPGVRGNSA